MFSLETTLPGLDLATHERPHTHRCLAALRTAGHDLFQARRDNVAGALQFVSSPLPVVPPHPLPLPAPANAGVTKATSSSVSRNYVRGVPGGSIPGGTWGAQRRHSVFLLNFFPPIVSCPRPTPSRHLRGGRRLSTPRSLDEHPLPPKTHSGGRIEAEGEAGVVQRTPLHYCLVRGRYVRHAARVEVVSAGRFLPGGAVPSRADGDAGRRE